MPNALLVVDMVVGFMEEGHNLYCGDSAREIIPHVRLLIEEHKIEAVSYTHLTLPTKA